MRVRREFFSLDHGFARIFSDFTDFVDEMVWLDDLPPILISKQVHSLRTEKGHSCEWPFSVLVSTANEIINYEIREIQKNPCESVVYSFSNLRIIRPVTVCISNTYRPGTSLPRFTVVGLAPVSVMP